jgi:hypothetical protein
VRYQRRLLTGAIGFFALVGMLAPAAAAQAQVQARTQAQPQAQPAPRSLFAPSALVLSLGYGEDTNTVQRAATLRCEPAGGDHPAAADACAELTRVDGDFISLRGQDGICTKEYRPVTVTVTGIWRGRHTSYRSTFANRCMLIQVKGSVFEF